MIKYYQELLNECIDIQEHRRILEILKEIKNLMKGNKKWVNLNKEKDIKTRQM